MSQTLTIAAAQFHIDRNVQTNGRAIRDLIAKAADNGARLVHFAEGALSGYTKKQINNWNDVDWDALRRELEMIAIAAGEKRIWVVVGSNHRLTPPHRPHNSLFVISDTGHIHTRYDKRMLSHAEISDWYTPGHEPVTFDVDGYRFGCALCIEIQFAEIFAEYERLGADCVLFSAYADDSTFLTQAQGHAAGNNFWISISTPAQCGAGLATCIVGPHGRLLSACAETSDLAYLLLDRDAPELEIAITKARPWRARARSGEIYAPHRVDDPRSRNRAQL